LIALAERVPDESTARKLKRRLGGEVVDELTRIVIGKAQRETRFRARAVRIDSTVVEADVRYPTDSGLALDSARVLAREARKVVQKVGRDAGWVTDRSRSIGRRVRAMTRTLRARSGESKEQRSATGWCRSSTRTPDRSARASSASQTSSGTSPKSAR